MTRPNPELAGREFLAQHLGGAQQAWQLKPLGKGRLNSRVYCASLRDSGRQVLLKQTPASDPAHGAAAQGAALIAALSRLGSDGPARVPAVLACNAEHGWLALEWIAGRAASEVLASAAESKALAAAEASGAWLAAFAASTGHSSIDTAARLADIDQVRAGHAAPAALSAAHARLQTRAPEIADCTVPMAWVHGDFKAANLLITPQGVWGIDLGPARRNLAIIDMASFLNDLRLNLPAERGRRLEAAFLAGHAMAVPRAALDWLRLQMLIERCLDRPAHWAQGLRHALLRPRLERLAQEIADRL